LIAFLAVVQGCFWKPSYHEEKLSLPCGVEVRVYFLCEEPECKTYAPTPSFQVLSAWGHEFRYESIDGLVEGVFVVSGRLFLVISNEFADFVKVVTQEGRLIPLCDLGECSLGNVYSTQMWRDERDLIVVMDTLGQCEIPKGELFRRRVPAVFVPSEARLLVSPEGEIDFPPEGDL